MADKSKSATDFFREMKKPQPRGKALNDTIHKAKPDVNILRLRMAIKYDSKYR